MERLLRHHAVCTEVRRTTSPSARLLFSVPKHSLVCALALTDGFRDLEESLGLGLPPTGTQIPEANRVALSSS